ncbi:hypothetical protein ACFX10_032046 [Malus domestica]|uniref:HAT C-terminal dimerisation domain-containing protein n=1 Tax=Malus domestica TaxID=3750 RepID=A0A498JYQ1_MALDO|nr:hypothetical protein DVH24_001254 [Malus domestica]
MDKQFKCLKWWKVHQEKYPISAKIARDVFAIPVSTVTSESTFSTGGRILDDYRSTLTPKMVEALICTQNWLKSPPIFSEVESSSIENMEIMSR